MGFRFRVQGIESKVCDFGVRVSRRSSDTSGDQMSEEKKPPDIVTFVQEELPSPPNLGFRASGFGFRVSGFRFRGSNFESRVLGFGFRVSPHTPNPEPPNPASDGQ